MYTVYLAGELFSLKHLSGNLLLAEALSASSGGKYRCILPQDLEQRDTTPLAIRNQDILAVLKSDLGVFHFDGPEPDTGTVVEFMIAKMLDVPSVIVRTDFRKGGDQGEDPWNLMMSFYPRTKSVLLDSMAIYQRHRRQQASAVSALKASANEVARAIIDGLVAVQSMPPVIAGEEQEHVLKWFRKFPGSGFDSLISEQELTEIFAKRRERSELAQQQLAAN